MKLGAEVRAETLRGLTAGAKAETLCRPVYAAWAGTHWKLARRQGSSRSRQKKCGLGPNGNLQGRRRHWLTVSGGQWRRLSGGQG